MPLVHLVSRILLVLPLLVGSLVAQQGQQKGEEFTAIAANISNVGAAGLVPVNIHVSRWTPDDEHNRLFATLRDKGQDAFLKELIDLKETGWIMTPTSLRYDFFYARQSIGEKGQRRIMMISDRPMNINERLSAATSRDYPFTVLQLDVDADGRGRGTLAQLVQLRLVGDILGVDNLATAPIQLNDVKKVK